MTTPATTFGNTDPRRLIEFVHAIANLHIDAHTTTDYLLLLDAIRDKARFVLMHYDAALRELDPPITPYRHGGATP